jgi:hypothetical protein
MSTTTTPIGDAREQALDRLRKRQDLRGHLLVYALVNVVLWSIWASVGGGFPWPLFVTAGWGIGVVMNVWDVYWRRPITEREIDEEVRRLQDG